MFPRNFSLQMGKSPTWQQVVVKEFGKRRDTTVTADLCPRQLVTDLRRSNETYAIYVNLIYRTHIRIELCVALSTASAGQYPILHCKPLGAGKTLDFFRKRFRFLGFFRFSRFFRFSFFTFF